MRCVTALQLDNYFVFKQTFPNNKLSQWKNVNFKQTCKKLSFLLSCYLSNNKESLPVQIDILKVGKIQVILLPLKKGKTNFYPLQQKALPQ